MLIRTLFTLLAALGALVCAAGFSSAAEPAMPSADGAAVVEYLKASPYTKWSLVPGTTAFREGKEPHGALQKVYANDAAMRGFTAKAVPMPDGTLIVKENYNTNKELQSLSVMYKKASFNPEAGDYTWLNLGPDLKIKAEGKLGGCIGCHTPAKAKDYIILSPIK